MESLDSNNSTIPISVIKKATFLLLNSLDGFEAKAVTKKVYAWFSVITLSLIWGIMLIRSTLLSDVALAPFSAGNMSRI